MGKSKSVAKDSSDISFLTLRSDGAWGCVVCGGKEVSNFKGGEVHMGGYDEAEDHFWYRIQGKVVFVIHRCRGGVCSMERKILLFSSLVCTFV